MDSAIVVGIASSLLGGTVVAAVTTLAGRDRNRAEAEKLRSEAERNRAETTRILIELNVRVPEPEVWAPESEAPDLPAGWLARGSRPEDYVIRVDRSVARSGQASGFIGSKSDASGFATLMQQAKAVRFLGQRIRMTAYVRTEGVTGRAQLWMRVDGTNDDMLSFDNMADRPVRGTTDWTQYSIVLDVDNTASLIAFGLVLGGPGKAWIDDIEFEAVGREMETTDTIKPELLPEAPLNLSFEE